MARTIFYGACVLALLAARSVAAQEVVIGWNDCGWRWHVYPGSEPWPNPPEYSVIGFDDSSWPTGCGPFSNPDHNCGTSGLTNWTGIGMLLIRRHVFNPFSEPVWIDCEVLTNSGYDIFLNSPANSRSGGGTECPLRLDNHLMSLPPGPSVITIRTFQGDLNHDPWWLGGFINFRAVARVATPAQRESWGAVKQRYR